MRLWAEEQERRRAADDAAGDADGSGDRQVLAAWAFTGVALALTFPIWITVNYLGDPDNGVSRAPHRQPVHGRRLLAIGACLSAVTRNQVIA
jgi:hypothetical protein